MTKYLKLSLLTFLFFVLTANLHSAEFKFGLMNAVKATADKLDKRFMELGGGVPKAPSGISASVYSYTQACISWTDNSSNEFGFRVKRNTTGPSETFSLAGTASANATFYVETGLIPGTTYYYKVFAYNGITETPQAQAPVSAVTLPLNITQAGFYFNSNAYRTQTQGNYAYLSCQSDGIRILNVTNPSGIVETGTYAPASVSVKGIYVSGNYLYAACGAQGLRILDVSNPSAPLLAGTYSPASPAALVNDVKVSGAYAYVALQNGGLDIVDISNPAVPSLAGQVTLNLAGANNIFLENNYAYIADGASGLAIINITDPAAPVLSAQVSSLTLPDGQASKLNASAVFIKDGFAFIADPDYGLRIADVSDPVNIKAKTGFVMSSQPNSVFVKDTYVFVTSNDGTLKVIGIFDKDNPAQFVSYSSISTLSVYVSNTNIYIATASGMGILASNLVYASSSSIPRAPSGLAATPTNRTRVSLTWKDNSDNEEGFKIERKSFFTSYLELGSVYENVTSFNDDSVVSGTSYYYRLRAYNSIGNSAYSPEVGPVNTVSTITLVGFYQTAGTAYGIAVSSIHAYIADGSDGLIILNVTKPAYPQLSGSYDTAGTAYDTVLNGNYAYVADGDQGVQVIDISKPAFPSLAGSYPGITSNNLCLQNSILYSASAAGFDILDISTPAAPSLVKSVSLPSPTNRPSLFISGQYLYYTDNRNGLRIYDVSKSSSPINISSATISGDLNGLSVSGSYAFLTNASYGVWIYDVSNPASPALFGSFNTPGNSNSVLTKGGHAYIADGSHGVRVVNYDNPAAPVEETSYDTPGTAYETAAGDRYIFVADGSSGMEILDFGISLSSGTYPEPVSSFMVTAAYPGQLNLSWQDNSSNEDGFRLYRASSPVSFSSTPDAVIAANTTFYIDTPLVPNSTYYYRIKPYNSSGASSPAPASGYTPFAAVTEKGFYATANDYYRVAASTSANIIYASESSPALFALDVLIPAVPSLLKKVNTTVTPAGIAVNGPYIFVAETTGGITPFDASIATSPVMLASIATAGTANSLDIKDNYLYLSNTGDFRIYSLAIASSPADPSVYALVSNVQDAAVYGNYAYLADYGAGLKILDISNKSSPSGTAAFAYDTAYSYNYASSIEASGNAVYVGDAEEDGNPLGLGLVLINAADKSSPSVFSIISSLKVYDMAVSGKYLYAACDTKGLYVFNIANPFDLHPVAIFDTPGNARGVSVKGNYIYIADLNSGIRILEANLP